MRFEARGTLPHPATSCNTLQHSLQHSLQHTYEVRDSRVTERTVVEAARTATPPQHSLQHSLQHTHEVWDSRVTDRTVFGSCTLTALRAGEFSQKSALKLLYIVNWLASWLLRISTSKHIVPRPLHVETDVCVCVWVCVSNVCLYACMYAWTYVCKYLCTYVWMSVYEKTARDHEMSCMYVGMYVSMYVICMYVCMSSETACDLCNVIPENETLLRPPSSNKIWGCMDVCTSIYLSIYVFPPLFC